MKWIFCFAISLVVAVSLRLPLASFVRIEIKFIFVCGQLSWKYWFCIRRLHLLSITGPVHSRNWFGKRLLVAHCPVNMQSMCTICRRRQRNEDSVYDSFCINAFTVIIYEALLQNALPIESLSFPNLLQLDGLRADEYESEGAELCSYPLHRCAQCEPWHTQE